MYIQSTGLKLFTDFSAQYVPSFGKSKKTDKKLERTPDKDCFECQRGCINVKKKNFSQSDNEIVLKNLNTIKKEKLLNEEILYFLEPKSDAKGRVVFSPSQALVIDAAINKLAKFKATSNFLAKEAKEYKDQCHQQIKDIFGGDEKYGKYIVCRAKDAEGIYDKLIKEFKDNKVKIEMMDLISQNVFGVPITEQNKDEKDFLKSSILKGEIELEPKDYRKIAKILACSKKSYNEEVNWIKDLVGTRLILPQGDEKELKAVERYLTKAIKNGDFIPTRVSNYHANHILPYINHETAKYWKQLIPGLRVVETSEVRKKNGYTTTQINLKHKVKNSKGREKELWGEFQIRTKELDYIGNVEHLIYDILQGKNIGKDIPELEKFYESVGIKQAVMEVFNDPSKEAAYSNYESAMYYYVRNKETNKNPDREYSLPRLHEYGLADYWQILSFESLRKIDEHAKEIKNKYKK